MVELYLFVWDTFDGNVHAMVRKWNVKQCMLQLGLINLIIIDHLI